jgi:ferredoxin
LSGDDSKDNLESEQEGKEEKKETKAAAARKRRKAERLEKLEQKANRKRNKSSGKSPASDEVSDERKLAVAHFLYNLPFLFWHYTQTCTTCSAACPFGHARPAAEALAAASPITGADHTASSLVPDSGNTDGGDDDSDLVSRRPSKRRRRIVIEEEEDEEEEKENIASVSVPTQVESDPDGRGGGEAVNATTAPAPGNASGSNVPAPAIQQQGTSKLWIPLTDAEALLCLAQCIEQIRLDVWQVIHPYNTCHVEGFHDLRCSHEFLIASSARC